jgi:signal transduction histidine kinase/DNA-binding response OmpR family regulator/HAMP domain-containing protein
MFSRALLHSRIARRILGLFVLCAVVPTSILGWVSYRQVTEQLIVQSSTRLKQESKSQGMVLYSHLLTLTADLDRIAAELPQHGILSEDVTITDSVKELGRRFREIRVLADPRKDRRGLTQAQVAHLQEGKSLLVITSSPNQLPQLTLTRLLDPKRWEAGLLSADIDEVAMWSTQMKDTLPGNTDLVIEDGERQVLYSTFPHQVTLPDFRRRDAAAPMGEGAIWQMGAQHYVAGAWSMPLRHMFLVEPWDIVLSQTRESALFPVEQFRHTFLLVIGSTLSIVVLLSLAHIRRSLHPVTLLEQGTARLASGDFTARVDVNSGDEFEDLARSFNGMTDKLSQQFHMLDTIAAISQAILSSHDPAAMVKIVQSRITEMVTCDVIGMIMVDPENTGLGQLSVRLVDSQSDDVSTYQCQLSAEHLTSMAAHPNHVPILAASVPSYLTGMMRPNLSLFALFPIIVADTVNGALILAYRKRRTAPPDDVATARRLADQLAVALANNRAIQARIRAQVALVGAVDARQQAEERVTILQETNRSLETKEERLHHQQSAMLALVENRTVFEDSLAVTANQVTTAAAKTLAVDRASVWFIEEQTESLSCLSSYDRDTDSHASGGKLPRVEYPNYFSALSHGRLIATAATQEDSAFSELVAEMVAPQQVRARIDAPFQIQGKLTGVVSIEHIGSSRDWAPDEQQFAQALANFMTLVVEASRRRESEEALALAKLAAEDATNAKAEFLANMSHEIRTPMNGVIGMTEILARTPLSETQRHYVETIHNSGDTLLTLINDILDFSKIEAGKLELQSAPIDLRDVVERAVEQLAEPAQRKGLHIFTDYEPSVPTAVRGDAMRIRQIMTNLLGNAIKFTQAGDVSVTVTLEAPPSDENGTAQIKLAVTDTGSGISPEGQTKLFQSFSQVDGSSTRVHGGTGLGLSICKQLSELMGGTIGVESTIGKGSTFWVTLPLPIQTDATITNQTDRSFAGLQVCGATSHPATRRLLTRYLSSWGISSHMADTGAEFLEQVMSGLASEGQRVIALVDETVVDMTDTELLEALTSDSALGAAKTLRLVSFIRRADVEQDASWNQTHFVTKPLRYESLRQALLNVLDSTPGALPQTQRMPATPTLCGHVLLGEDNPVNQEITLLMLQALGCSVTIAQNGREVLDQVKQSSYDLVLMDCQMPEMDGFEATRLIREWEKLGSRTAIPIIALTAHATPEDREHCLATGMSDYLSKPFSMERIHTVLAAWLRPNSSKEPGGPTTPAITTAPVVTLSEQESQPALTVDQRAWASITSLQRAGSPDTLAKILSLYLADSQELVDKVRQGMATGDVTAVNQAAHSLKSRSAVLGATSLATICQQFENFSRQGHLKEADPLLDQLDAAFSHASQVFQGELERRAA